jgi:hypothetical protein
MTFKKTKRFKPWFQLLFKPTWFKSNNTDFKLILLASYLSTFLEKLLLPLDVESIGIFKQKCINPWVEVEIMRSTFFARSGDYDSDSREMKMLGL